MCCLSPDSAGGELILGWRKSALFFKSPLSERLQDASSDFWKTVLAEFRQPRACLKKAFCKMCVTICGRFLPDEGAVAGYGNRIRVKYTAKWGVQIAGMIFQTRSRSQPPTKPRRQAAHASRASVFQQKKNSNEPQIHHCSPFIS